MVKSMFCAAILVMISSSWSLAQRPPDYQNPLRAIDPTILAPPSFEGRPSNFERRLLEHQNLDRQNALKRDTDKLLELASQLKQNVDRTNANVLSMDVIKKAQEIEKLAKSVREKMKGD